jgi:hypothetical protein
VPRLQNPGWFHPRPHLRAMNRRAATALRRAELSQIPVAPVGGLLALLISGAVGVVVAWWNDPPSRETRVACTRLFLAILASGLISWLVASGSTHLAEALIAVTLAFALSVRLLG